jgi:hypothetical protein
MRDLRLRNPRKTGCQALKTVAADRTRHRRVWTGDQINQDCAELGQEKQPTMPSRVSDRLNQVEEKIEVEFRVEVAMRGIMHHSKESKRRNRKLDLPDEGLGDHVLRLHVLVKSRDVVVAGRRSGWVTVLLFFWQLWLRCWQLQIPTRRWRQHFLRDGLSRRVTRLVGR